MKLFKTNAINNILKYYVLLQFNIILKHFVYNFVNDMYNIQMQIFIMTSM